MTEHKYTDEEVIKALECCSKDVPLLNSCEGCPFAGEKCAAFLPQTALDLINRQKAEVERLEHIRADLSKENDRLRSEKDKLIKSYKVCVVDAVELFAERIKDNQNRLFNCIYSEYHFGNMIETLVKEFTEEKT